MAIMSFSPLAKYWCDVADVVGKSNKKPLCLNPFDFRQIYGTWLYCG